MSEHNEGAVQRAVASDPPVFAAWLGGILRDQRPALAEGAGVKVTVELLVSDHLPGWIEYRVTRVPNPFDEEKP